MSQLERYRQIFQIRNPLIVNCLTELYATCLLLFLGISIVCQTDLSKKSLNTWIQINFGWGFAITFCVYAASKTSGGHLNPAISVLFYTFGKIPLSYVFAYSFCQLIGAFIGTICAYLLYYDQIYHVLGVERIAVGPNATATLFTSMPPPHLSNTIAFFDQFVGTGFLALFASVVIDKRINIPAALHALLFGFVVALIGMAFGMNLGYPINPARDLAPRIFAAMIGYGIEVFTYHNYYFWIPIVAPILGAIFFAWSYYVFVGFHIPDNEENKVIAKKANQLENTPLKNQFDV